MEGREPLSQHGELKPENGAGERHQGDTAQQFLGRWGAAFGPGIPREVQDLLAWTGACINPIVALNNEVASSHTAPSLRAELIQWSQETPQHCT